MPRKSGAAIGVAFWDASVGLFEQDIMDRKRRQFLTALGAVPFALLDAPRHGRGAETPPAASPVTPNDPAIVLEARAGGATPRPPLQYGEGSPGPILRVRRGAVARIILRNRLRGPTSLDLHGVHVPPLLGGAGPLGGGVAPGAEAEIAFVPPDSGTFWFHPWIFDRHLDETAEGLSGVLLVEEEDPPEVDADRVLILSDRDAPSGPVSTSPGLPDRLWVDGGAWPKTERLKPGSRLRLRVVNASTRVAVAVACSGTDPFVVAIDGQPSELFKPRADTVPVGPGARFDLVLDLPRTAGAEVRVVVSGSAPGAQPETALLITTQGEVGPERPPIRPPPPNPLLTRAIPLEASTRATLAVQRKPGAAGEAAVWTVNGISGLGLSKKPLFTVRRGSPVTLGFKNASTELAGFRLHGFAMRLLHDLDDGWEPYWRDSVLVPPGVTHHAAFLADRSGRWLIESPFFDQSAAGLRTWFEIT